MNRTVKNHLLEKVVDEENHNTYSNSKQKWPMEMR